MHAAGTAAGMAGPRLCMAQALMQTRKGLGVPTMGCLAVEDTTYNCPSQSACTICIERLAGPNCACGTPTLPSITATHELVVPKSMPMTSSARSAELVLQARGTACQVAPWPLLEPEQSRSSRFP
jgi:hypothetical protein